MQSEKPTLSIIVPAYNEGRRIDFLMTTLLKFLPQTSLSYEIILVDDGSSDDTYQLAYHYQKNNISIIKNNKNYGKGYAIKVGVEKAQGKYILFMDADLSTSLEEISPFLSCLEKDQADIVIGTRQHGDAKIAIPQPWLRKSLGRFFIFLTNLLLRVNISDIKVGDAIVARGVIKDMEITASKILDGKIPAKKHGKMVRANKMHTLGLKHF